MRTEQVQKTKPKEEEEDAVPLSPTERKEKLKADLDAILDDIDKTLTENEAKDFVKNYQQKGGE